jgi:tellurite resistance-related uncharacterized protein
LYNQTPSFSQSTIPEGLTKRHQTKAGVWGRIVVQSGSLRYRISDSDEAHTLTEGTPGVIEPEAFHQVEVVGPVRFHIEFLR